MHLHLCLCSWMSKSANLRLFINTLAQVYLLRAISLLVFNSVAMHVLLSCLFFMFTCPFWVEREIKAGGLLKGVWSLCQHPSPVWTRLKELGEKSLCSGFSFQILWICAVPGPISLPGLISLGPPWIHLCCYPPFLLTHCSCFWISHLLLDDHASGSLAKCILLGSLTGNGEFASEADRNLLFFFFFL